MKKIAAILLATMMMILGATAFAAGQRLSLEEAKQIALTRAGVTEAEAVFTKAHADRDDGRMVYELEFHVGHTEYEMDVDAYTGKITDCSKEYYGGYGRGDRSYGGYGRGFDDDWDDRYDDDRYEDRYEDDFDGWFDWD